MNFKIGGEGDFQISKINHAGQEPSLTFDGNAENQTLDAFQSPDKQSRSKQQNHVAFSQFQAQYIVDGDSQPNLASP